jgi:hypothetical protein
MTSPFDSLTPILFRWPLKFFVFVLAFKSSLTCSMTSLDVLPSNITDQQLLPHLSGGQQHKLANVLNRYLAVSSDVHGYTDVSLSASHIDKDSVTNRFEPYRIPDQLKAEVGT